MLSLSMIVRNEQERLGICLNSVKGFTDEMVIVDTGSTDNTIAIAKAAGARVEQLVWPGDFAPARNAALNFVRGDWVLVLDADEYLRPEVIPPLKALMAQPDVLVINLLRHEQGAAMAPYSSVSRLFRRHPRIRWSRPYHSMVDDSVRELLQDEPHWRIADCPEPALLHRGYSAELLEGTDKAERLRRSMQQWLEKDPGNPYACAKLGALEVADGERLRGIALLHEGLANLKEGSEQASERYELFLHLGIALSPENINEAMDFYRQALAQPLDIRLSLGARLNLAALLLQANRIDEAIQLTATACQRAPEVALAWYNFGLMQRRKGDIKQAMQAYERALSLEPNRAEYHQNFAVARLVGGDIDGARASFRQAITLLNSQGKGDQASALQDQVSGLVKLNETSA